MSSRSESNIFISTSPPESLGHGSPLTPSFSVFSLVIVFLDLVYKPVPSEWDEAC